MVRGHWEPERLPERARREAWLTERARREAWRALATLRSSRGGRVHRFGGGRRGERELLGPGLAGEADSALVEAVREALRQTGKKDVLVGDLTLDLLRRADDGDASGEAWPSAATTGMKGTALVDALWLRQGIHLITLP